MSSHAPNNLRLSHRLSPCLAGALAAMFSITTAFAADTHQAGDAQSRYKLERTACTDGSSHQDRATCLKEAGAALGEARGGRLGSGSTASDANATARCNALPDKDRSDCIARIQGAGTSSGSVKEGGIYRELVTRTPSPQSAPPNTSSAEPQE